MITSKIFINTKAVLCFCESYEEILRHLRMKFPHANVPFLYFSVLKEDPLEEELKNFENIAQKILIPFALQNLVKKICESSSPSQEKIEKFNQKSFQEWARKKLHSLRFTSSKIYSINDSVIKQIRKTLNNKK